MEKAASPVEIDHHPKLVEEGIFILDGDVWSNQRRIAKLYGRSVPTINDHIKKMFKDKELLRVNSERVLVVKKKEGKKQVKRNILVYNTETVIALGFRVNGPWGKAFRLWARDIVKKSFDPKAQVLALLRK